MGQRETLCWSCKRGALDCKWMACGEPVRGWTATKTRIMQIDGKYLSAYRITACPDYIREDRESTEDMRRCPVCNKQFAAKGNRKYCSKLCYELGQMRIL